MLSTLKTGVNRGAARKDLSICFLAYCIVKRNLNRIWCSMDSLMNPCLRLWNREVSSYGVSILEFTFTSEVRNSNLCFHSSPKFRNILKHQSISGLRLSLCHHKCKPGGSVLMTPEALWQQSWGPRNHRGHCFQIVPSPGSPVCVWSSNCLSPVSIYSACYNQLLFLSIKCI